MTIEYVHLRSDRKIKAASPTLSDLACNAASSLVKLNAKSLNLASSPMEYPSRMGSGLSVAAASCCCGCLKGALSNTFEEMTVLGEEASLGDDGVVVEGDAAGETTFFSIFFGVVANFAFVFIPFLPLSSRSINPNAPDESTEPKRPSSSGASSLSTTVISNSSA